ncbi:hypothetical protein GGR77_003680 [Xanthomonas translucens]
MKTVAAALLAAVFALANGAMAQPSAPDLSSIADGKSWRVFHADVERTEKDGSAAVRLSAKGDPPIGIVGLALPRALTFSTGTIEVDLKGKNVKQRSFLGVAFNVIDERTFEAVYFRPFNFNAEEPISNRSVQYIAWPDNTWERLRKDAPGQFEKAVNPAPDPDAWFHAKVEVTASQVRVFVNHAKEPSLVVARLSSGGIERPVGLFVDSDDGQYANLKVTPLRVLHP